MIWSPLTDRTLTPSSVCPTGTACGSPPLIISMALLPMTPASPTSCAAAANGIRQRDKASSVE
jgi:hypothetical protein